ncbi:DUF4145 domain-containing protein [Sinorhizobium medicae]|nr:DUF4145 domain-containing protein [Sinorhizobium medicae]
MIYKTPSFGSEAFNCPYCAVLASQSWHRLNARHVSSPETLHALGSGMPFIGDTAKTSLGDTFRLVQNLTLSACFHCSRVAVWMGETLAFPEASSAPRPNQDLPEDVLKDYEEASAIVGQSPRGAAALLRLAIQKLCIHLGQAGKNINNDIGALVKAGLDPRVQKALDVVRVVGNNAVHPGEIDVDDLETAQTLFRLVNLIADKMITEPKHLDDVYNDLPAGVREAIERRDGKVPPAAKG